MNENNPLMDKCRDVLQEKGRANRGYKRDSVKMWIRDQKVDDLIEHVKNLPYKELKIAMKCGLYGRSMTVAMQRLDEYKDQIERIVEEQMNTISPISSEKPSLDETKGLDQLKQDLAMKMIQNTDDETLVIFTDMVLAEKETRKPRPSPDVT